MKYKYTDRRIYHKPECKKCILDVAIKYLKMAYGTDFKNETRFLQDKKKLSTLLHDEFGPGATPNEVATMLFLKSAELAENPDPWKQIRELSNKVALDLLPFARDRLDRIHSPKDRLFHAIEWAITGNTLDFGTAGHEVKLVRAELLSTYHQVQDRGFVINQFESLWTDLQDAGSVLYLCDNAGEIVFDRLVISEIQQLGVNVIAVVKGGPISNDAIYDDAEHAGLSEICEVATTGSPDLGFDPDHCSPQFLNLLNGSAFVIAKGQANWECIYAYQDVLAHSIKFYNILKLKCAVHWDLFKVPPGSNLIYSPNLGDFK